MHATMLHKGHTCPDKPVPSRHCMQARILLSSDKRPAAYMRMFYVSSQATKQVAARLRDGEADDVAGFVIDLRNNPGKHPAWRPCSIEHDMGYPSPVWRPRDVEGLQVSAERSYMQMHGASHGTSSGA